MRKISLTLMMLAWSVLCVADDHEKPPELIAESWTVIPKSGHEADFVKAFKEHLKVRAEAGDPRSWQVYSPVTGSKLNHYIVRSCCHQWGDQDTYKAWGMEAGTGKHWNEHVHPHVYKYKHNFSVLDTEHSNWPEGTKANYVGVTMYDTKSGERGRDTFKALKKMSKKAKEHGWEHPWSWFYPVGGTGGQFGLAIPFENYADMAPLEESFSEFMGKHMKKKKLDAMFDDFGNGIEGTEYTLYEHLKDMSMEMKKE